LKKINPHSNKIIFCLQWVGIWRDSNSWVQSTIVCNGCNLLFSFCEFHYTREP